MTSKTITRADLLEVVYACCPSLSRVQAKDIIEIALDEICSTLLRGETVKLRGFGAFAVRAKAARVGRNPRTLQEFPITARRVLTFKPSPRLIDALNGVAEAGRSTEKEAASQSDRWFDKVRPGGAE